MSISYAETEETHAGGTAANTGNSYVTQDSDSLQIAYSMGAMSVKAYSTSVSNPNYDTNAKELSVNEIAIGLAF